MKATRSQPRPEPRVPAPPKERAVLYLRMSRALQEASIPSQRAELTAYAQKHGYTIVREYSDSAISGDATEKRTAFLKMRDDAASGEFAVILCWDQDRFGRFDPIEGGFWILPFRNAGVRLETVAQGRIDWHDFSGRLMYTVMQEGKHQFLRDLSRNVVRGMIRRVSTGAWPGGEAPYGYEIGDDGHLVLGDPREVAAVREMFRLRLLGYGYRSIAREMNDKGIPAPRIEKWSHDGVRIVLSREAYTGMVVLGRDGQGRYYTCSDGEIKPVKRSQKREAKGVCIENAHPAIVSRADFEAAEKTRLAACRPHTRKDWEGAPLSGILFCGRCGARMYSQSLARKAGQKFPNYICSTYQHGKGCGYCSVQQKGILSAVARALRAHVIGSSLDSLEQAVAAELERRRQQAEPATDNGWVERQIADLDRKIVTAVDRLISVDRAHVPLVEQKLTELRQERERLAAVTAKTQAKHPTLDPKQVASRIWQLDEVLQRGSPAQIRAALGHVIDRVVLNFEPGRRSNRGLRYDFVGGSIEVCSSKEWGSLGSSPR